MTEVALDVFGQVQQPPHEPLDSGPELFLAIWQPLVIDPALQVVVQVLVRVQLRCPTRQVEQLDSVVVGRRPFRHTGRLIRIPENFYAVFLGI